MKLHADGKIDLRQKFNLQQFQLFILLGYVLPVAFLEKYPGHCSMDVNQLSKYLKKTFESHENCESSTLENDRSDDARPHL